MACACKSGKKQVLQLVDTIEHNHETFSFDFTSLEKMTWFEGDSSTLFMLMDESSSTESRKFSYASLPQEQKIRFTTRIRPEASLYKKQLRQLSIGDFVEITQPSGDFRLVRDGRPALLLSNGVGIATMRGLVHAFHNDSEGVESLTQINVDSIGHIYDEEFEVLAKKNINLKSIYMKHRDDFYSAVDLETQELMFRSGRMPYFYIVGSDGFLMDVSAFIKSIGFDDEDIILDQQSSGSCGCNKKQEAKVMMKGRQRPTHTMVLPHNFITQ